jgi:mannosyltransferase
MRREVRGLMATYASRAAWDLRGRAITGARVAVPAGLGVLLAVSLLLRTTQLGIGFWIDEGLSVGIADRPLSDIPFALREDGSPPLYYMLLHFWLDVAGRSEAGVRGLSLLFALLAIPASFWAGRTIFGTMKAAWIAAALSAFNPFLGQYAQEARMYSLVALLAIPATVCFMRAYALDAESPRARRPWIAGFSVSVAVSLYTHNWPIFFTMSAAAAWVLLFRLAPSWRRRELLRDGLLGFGGAVALYLPWVPTTLYQAAHTGAPWSEAPAFGSLLGVPATLLGRMPQIVLLICAGAGLIALLKSRDAEQRLGPHARAAAALLVMSVLTVAFAWALSQISPAWANRYLAVALPPFLLLAAGGLAHAGRLGLVGALLVVVMWSQDSAPVEKSNVRAVMHAIGPSLQPGDLVISTQPETVPVLHYYLPDGLRYATLTGPLTELGVWDWRDGVQRLQATDPDRDLKPVIDALPTGSRVVLVEPITWTLNRWQAPWTSLVRIRSKEWAQYLSNDPRLQVAAIQPTRFTPPRPNPVQATVMVKIRR